MDISSVKKVYFLGIGGIGVSAIARMMMHEGKSVSGSDTSDSEIVAELRKAGADIFIGQDIAHIPSDTDLVIYTIAVPHFAPEFFAGVKAKFKDALSYPEMLSIISKDKYTIAIAGTHGKTTTTAMLAKVLMDAGLDPTVIVGSILKDSKTNFIAGRSKYLVVEACEYQRSFLEIDPTVVGITTIDDDHLDYYKDHDDIVSAFKEFAEKIPEGGAFAGDMTKPDIADVSKISKGKILDADNFYVPGLKLKMPGEHNRRNAAVVLAIASFLSKFETSITKEKAHRSLEEFGGTWRRFEYKGETENGAIVYDDYGHHPAEIEATLAGARELYPGKSITIVFQPHLYSRTKLLFDDFAKELSKADRVILAPIYAAREENDPKVTSAVLADKIALTNENVQMLGTFAEIEREIIKNSDENDVVIVMGAGDIYTIADKLIHGK